ncbi:hypothetical protein QM480_09700 [Flectobacillus sp. DC10W]|uniref:Uncharacterized protein n=1 Tax=Flectobacillus longus TaxID=2984207 RepID=A0ABT6YM42_9BACT|nr:hypothetical protein [Flectobacillus longus]MDI9864595.1 hypothetical protein [Flectobacillus longus]
MKKKSNYKESLIQMLEVVKSDINALVSVAEAAAKNDRDIAYKNGEISYPTTMPVGANPVVTSIISESRLTIPLTMVCFSIIDLAGKLISDKGVKAENKNQKCNSKNESSMEKDGFLSHAKAYFKILANWDDLINDTSARRLQDAYRHSIAHAFLPGATHRIGYRVSFTECITENSLFIKQKDSVILNVKLLSKLTLKGIEKLKDILNETEDRDKKELANKILINFENLIKDNAERLACLDS